MQATIDTMFVKEKISEYIIIVHFRQETQGIYK